MSHKGKVLEYGQAEQSGLQGNLEGRDTGSNKNMGIRAIGTGRMIRQLGRDAGNMGPRPEPCPAFQGAESHHRKVPNVGMPLMSISSTTSSIFYKKAPVNNIFQLKEAS